MTTTGGVLHAQLCLSLLSLSQVGAKTLILRELMRGRARGRSGPNQALTERIKAQEVQVDLVAGRDDSCFTVVA
jgi:hypothetical protein